MTTAVTIDTHAGWPVSVTTCSNFTHEDGSGIQTRNTEVIPPYTTKIIYIHDGMFIENISENKKDS